VSKPYAQKHVLLPLDRTDSGALVVAVANPFDRELLAKPHRLAGDGDRAGALGEGGHPQGHRRHLRVQADPGAGGDGLRAADGPGDPDFEQLVSLSGNKELDASDKPIVQAVDYLLRYAYDNRASDIHIEPKRDSTVVRLRIDGVLHPVYTLPTGVHPPIVSRVKMLSPHRHLGEAAPAGRTDQDRA
jgi:general secretion pathway protein E